MKPHEIKLYEMMREEVKDLIYQATHFNLHYNTTKKYEVVRQRLLEVVGKQGVKEVWCVITNTARAIASRADSLKIPKNDHAYKSSTNPQGINRRKMYTLLDKMVEQELFVFYKGGFCREDSSIKYASLYAITDKFRAMFNGVEIKEVVEYTGEVVEIKDRKTGELMNSKVKGTSNMRAIIRAYNELLSKAVFTIDKVTLPVQQYKRVFSGSLDKGGRWYNVVGGVQIMSPDMRKKIEIDGVKVVELDFKALHPSMLYEEASQECPDDVAFWIQEIMHGKFDPYVDNGLGNMIFVDFRAIEEYREKWNKPHYDPIRNLIKFGVLVCLNASAGSRHPMGSAALAILHEYNKDKERPEERQKFYGIGSSVINEHGYQRFYARPVCEYVAATNYPIQKHFFTDRGVYLQNKDGAIVEDVIEEMTKRGVVVLSEHDSIICTEEHADEVEKLMREAYKKHMGSDKFCQIERK